MVSVACADAVESLTKVDNMDVTVLTSDADNMLKLLVTNISERKLNKYQIKTTLG